MRVGIPAVCFAVVACAPISVTTQPAATQSAAYKYELTPESAYICGVFQNVLADLKKGPDPEWSKRHRAMSLSWFNVANIIGQAPLPAGKSGALAITAMSQFAVERPTLNEAAELAKPCEVMSSLNRGDYRAGVELAQKEKPELFTDDAAYKRQIGGEYPDAPTKELTFDDWFFFAKGNLCFAASTQTEKGQLTLGFINFFDGSLRLEGDNLPELTEDNYEPEMAKHQAGIGWSKEEDVYLPVLDEGVTYETFKGSAIFIDKQPIAMLNGDYLSMGKKYIFGAHIQRPYFNLMPVGQEMTVKILGEETHRFPTHTALWNEIGECMAQYPFG